MNAISNYSQNNVFSAKKVESKKEEIFMIVICYPALTALFTLYSDIVIDVVNLATSVF